MGQLSFKNMQIEISSTLVELQECAMKKISNLFLEIQINQLRLNCKEGIGVRGKYDNMINNQVELSYQYYEYYFEFYLSYDQLEYYISKEGEIIKKCNLEDFWKDEIMIERYINYLKKDLKKLKIPFNDI